MYQKIVIVNRKFSSQPFIFASQCADSYVSELIFALYLTFVLLRCQLLRNGVLRCKQLTDPRQGCQHKTFVYHLKYLLYFLSVQQ